MLKQPRKGWTPTDAWPFCLALLALCHLTLRADTVYRCGNTYSPFNQCTTGPAEEIKPNAGQHSAQSMPSNTAAHDLREAQNLEKQRRQTERQGAPSTPVRFNTARPPMAREENTEPQPRREHNRYEPKRQSPYFTAVDPNTPRKKKSTAPAVPSNNP
jgi:hypothetical protein